MDKQLKEFFYDEVDRGRLAFEDDPEYNTLMDQSLSLFSGGNLPTAVSRLLDTSNCISFVHGLRLGLRLNRWSAP